MLVFRSLTLGLLGACVLLLAQRRDTHVIRWTQAPSVAPAPSSVPTIINIGTKECHVGSGGFVPCFTTDLMPLLALAPDERVTAFGDDTVDVETVAAMALANGIADPQPSAREFATSYALWSVPKGRGRYLDVAIESPRGERRVLVLMH